MKNFRKILKKQEFTIGGQEGFYLIILCKHEYVETKYTYKYKEIVVQAYLNNKIKQSGTAIYYPNKKQKSIKKDLSNLPDLKNTLKKAANIAYQNYLLTLTKLTGTVLWFNRQTGEGEAEVYGFGIYPVYACNLKGKKTWYPETACVYLEPNQEIIIDKFREIHDCLTPIISQGVKFDKKKWDSLDQSKLAFKCDEDGNAITGLGVNLW